MRVYYYNVCRFLHVSGWSGCRFKLHKSIQSIIDKYVPITTGAQKKRNIYMSPEAFSLKKKSGNYGKAIATLSKTDHDYKAFKEARNKLRRLT